MYKRIVQAKTKEGIDSYSFYEKLAYDKDNIYEKYNCLPDEKSSHAFFYQLHYPNKYQNCYPYYRYEVDVDTTNFLIIKSHHDLIKIPTIKISFDDYREYFNFDIDCDLNELHQEYKKNPRIVDFKSLLYLYDGFESRIGLELLHFTFRNLLKFQPPRSVEDKSLENVGMIWNPNCIKNVTLIQPFQYKQ